jgi:hypothetical protein
MNQKLKHQLDVSTRRSFMASAARTAFGVSLLPLGQQAALAASANNKRLIYLFMTGAMSQVDTFDPKPGSSVQGETGVVDTTVAGVQFGEHFSNLAGMADRLAIVRSMSTETGAHGPGQYLMRTGYEEIATTRHPGLGAWLQRLGGKIHDRLPASVLIGGGEGPGYLGTQYAPVPIGNPSAGLQNTKSPKYLLNGQFDRRMRLATAFDSSFRSLAKDNRQVTGYDELYQEAIGLLKSEDLTAFDISKESKKAHELYGKSRFGQGCLLARRLVENGVRYVEVAFKGWDHHNNVFERLPEKAKELDLGAAALLSDLDDRGLLEDTLVVIGTEFGRKPHINENAGRDHHPAAFSCAMAGAGVRGGQVVGATDAEAFYVEDNKVGVSEFNATIGHLLGLNYDQEIHSPEGRPFTLANGGKPIPQLI